MPRMTEDELKAVLKGHISASVSYTGGVIAEERKRNLDYYYSRPFGNEPKLGERSTVVTSDVQDTIESVMGDLFEIFAGSDDVVTFEPVGPEDEQNAKQATEYVRHVW